MCLATAAPPEPRKNLSACHHPGNILTSYGKNDILTLDGLLSRLFLFHKGTNQVADKKPRVRKVETVRERTAKETAKAEAKAGKQPRTHRVRSAAGKAAKPLSKPARILTWPFRTRPVRFVGRVLGRIVWPRYFRNAWIELKQVTWPGRKETWKLTFAVLIFAVVFGLAAAGTDFVLDKVIRRIVFRG
jgi:preprotein translocase SecE subunit